MRLQTPDNLRDPRTRRGNPRVYHNGPMAAGPALAAALVPEAEREANLLVTLLDVSDAFLQSLQLDDPAQHLSVTQCLDNVTTFLNSYLLLQQSNSVGVCLCYVGGSRMVYPVASREEVNVHDLQDEMTSGKYEPLVHMNALLSEEVRKTMADITSGGQVGSSSALSGALSKCLCYVQRRCREAPLGTKLNSRILVIMTSPDVASQYVPTMNCIFAAQKHKITIDSCVLWQDSGFLQQASDITGGIYLKTPEPAGLLQFLLWTFLPDSSSRGKLMLPSAVKVDYHASCFCHHRLIDIGHVCSVCLSIFCQFTPICTMCQAHFKLPNLPLAKVGKSKKKAKSKDNTRL